jgi:hypothetical protein
VCFSDVPDRVIRYLGTELSAFAAIVLISAKVVGSAVRPANQSVG